MNNERFDNFLFLVAGIFGGLVIAGTAGMSWVYLIVAIMVMSVAEQESKKVAKRLNSAKTTTANLVVDTLEDGYVRVLNDGVFVVGGMGGLDVVGIDHLLKSLGYTNKTEEAERIIGNDKY